MAGKKGRSGRPRLPIELHLAKGTYRRDRHGDRPVTRPVASAVAAGLLVGATGGAVAARIRAEFAVDDPAGLVYLQRVEALVDRLGALSGALDGQHGLLAALAAGGAAVRTVDALVRAERLAAEQLSAALIALELDVSASPARRGAAS